MKKVLGAKATLSTLVELYDQAQTSWLLYERWANEADNAADLGNWQRDGTAALNKCSALWNAMRELGYTFNEIVDEQVRQALAETRCKAQEDSYPLR